jgi:hypothetical protein
MARSSKAAPEQAPKASNSTLQEEITPSPHIPPAQATFAPQVMHSESYRNIYCNNIRIGISQWDLSIGVGQIMENKDGTSTIQEEAMVKFSPQFFKTFVYSVATALENWEATFGEISLGLGQTFKPGHMEDAFRALKDILNK